MWWTQPSTRFRSAQPGFFFAQMCSSRFFNRSNDDNGDEKCMLRLHPCRRRKNNGGQETGEGLRLEIATDTTREASPIAAQ